jgi:hypothetical protein
MDGAAVVPDEEAFAASATEGTPAPVANATRPDMTKVEAKRRVAFNGKRLVREIKDCGKTKGKVWLRVIWEGRQYLPIAF